mmetsp:Transcript_99944/g.193005  ORF Transcript_99944/g.193005 Transcript_99944/m.193005 type:complete len:128 (-) Transcript_99944:13-396(-)
MALRILSVFVRSTLATGSGAAPTCTGSDTPLAEHDTTWRSCRVRLCEYCIMPANVTATVVLIAPFRQHHRPCVGAGTPMRISRGASQIDSTTPCLDNVAGGGKTSMLCQFGTSMRPDSKKLQRQNFT